MDIETNSSEYWRKLLAADEMVDPQLFSRFENRSLILRKGAFNLINLLAKTAFRMKVYGKENLPKDRNFIIACNHLSAFDYGFLVCDLEEQIREQIYVIAKKYIFDKARLRFWVDLLTNAFPIDVEDNFLSALKQASGILKSGKSIFIAPEGTRSHDGQLGPFRVGVGVLAVELNVPIVPACLKGTFEVLHRRTYIPKFAQVKVAFGKPIEMKDYHAMKGSQTAYYIYKEATDNLRNKILELQGQLNQS